MRPLSSLRAGHYRLMAALWTIGIVLLVTIPTGNLPKVQSAFGLDKVAHTFLFAVFGVLWLRGVCPPIEGAGVSGSHWRGLVLFGAGVLFALGTELYQHVALPGRTGDPYDGAADLVGLLVAFGGYYAVQERLAVRSDP